MAAAERRDGSARRRPPDWSEVVNEFGLDNGKLSSRQLALIRGFHRGHTRIAEGKKVRGRRLLRRITNLPDFEELEFERGSLLSQIVDFTQGKTRRGRY